MLREMNKTSKNIFNPKDEKDKDLKRSCIEEEDEDVMVVELWGEGMHLRWPEKWLRRPEGENMIRAISMSQRTDSS